RVAIAEAGAPRTEVDLVDAHRPAVRVVLCSGGHPLLVSPLVARGDDDASRRGRDLAAARERVGLLTPRAVAAEDLELVARPWPDAGHEERPHPRGAEGAHRVGRALPVTEVADEPDGSRVGRPHGEGRAVYLAEHRG